jgi:putative copper resistance protein D
MPKSVLLLSVLGIIVFSLGPVLQVIFYFSDSVGFNLTTFSVLFDFQVGKAWIFTAWIAVFLYLTIYVEGSKYIQALLLFFMVLAVGYASHVASLSFWTGFLSHSVHFLSVILWTGILFHVSWFVQEPRNWRNFLKWFTKLAVGCMVALIGSGFITMLYVVDIKDYMNAWVLPYGQFLLLKHIGILPLLAFAFINGILFKKTKTDSLFNPLPWVRAESITVMIIFFLTSILGTLSPPHDVSFTVKSEGTSSWIQYLLGGEIEVPVSLDISLTIQAVSLFIMGTIFLGFIVLSFYKQVKPFFAVIFGCLFIISTYFGLMVAVL